MFFNCHRWQQGSMNLRTAALWSMHRVRVWEVSFMLTTLRYQRNTILEVLLVINLWLKELINILLKLFSLMWSFCWRVIVQLMPNGFQSFPRAEVSVFCVYFFLHIHLQPSLVFNIYRESKEDAAQRVCSFWSKPPDEKGDGINLGTIPERDSDCKCSGPWNHETCCCWFWRQWRRGNA